MDRLEFLASIANSPQMPQSSWQYKPEEVEERIKSLLHLGESDILLPEHREGVLFAWQFLWKFANLDEASQAQILEILGQVEEF